VSSGLRAKRDIAFVIRDSNVVVGDDQSDNQVVMGEFGNGRMNKRVGRLFKLCRDSDFIIVKHSSNTEPVIKQPKPPQIEGLRI